jgi:hypothetical protein
VLADLRPDQEDVYLNGWGDKLTASDGTGAWWVEHSWIVDGEGYRNCELMPPPEEVLDYDADCVPVIGEWQEDQITMRVGLAGPTGGVLGIYNERRPVLAPNSIAYSINRINPTPRAEPSLSSSPSSPTWPAPWTAPSWTARVPDPPTK